MRRYHLLGADDLFVLNFTTDAGSTQSGAAEAAFLIVVTLDHAVACSHEDLVEFRMPNGADHMRIRRVHFSY